MAPLAIQFVVQFMPPSRPAGALRTPNAPAQGRTRALRMAFHPTSTFQQAWTRIREDFDKAYAAEEREYTDFVRLQAPLGVDIVLSSTIGSLFSADTPLSERTLYVEQVFVDHESSIAPGSALQPVGYKRKLVGDLTPDKQRTLKRRRIEECRYGTSLSALDADTPVMSRENAETSAGADEAPLKQFPQKVDTDGFKIPSRISRPQSAKHDRDADWQRTVLIEDSQPQIPPSSLSASRERNNTASRYNAERSMPPNSSSPAEQAASRLNSAVPQSRPADVRPPRQASSRTPIAPIPRRSTIPTPDSNEHRWPNKEGDSSGQGPPSAQTSTTTQFGRFLPRRHATVSEAEQDLSCQDPIDDDDFFNGTDDDVLEPRHSRGRTSTRSLEDAEQQFLPEKSPLVAPHSSSKHSTDKTSDDTVQSTPGASDFPPSVAFDTLLSSQSNRQSSGDRSGKWTAEEDRQLLDGIRARLTMTEIIKKYNLTRTGSSLRNRRKILLDRYPDGVLPQASDANDEKPYTQPDSVRASSTTATARWQRSDIARLRDATAAGLDPSEMKAKHFPGRTLGAVQRKWRELKEEVFENEQKRGDFPKDGTPVTGWTVEHSLKLRRAYLDPAMRTEDARRLWFPQYPLRLIERKMKLYKDQVARSGIPAEKAAETIAEQEESIFDPAGEDDAASHSDVDPVQHDVRMDRQEPALESPWKSSPPKPPDRAPSRSPDAIFTHHLQPSRAHLTYGGGKKAKPRHADGRQRQTKLPFEIDKRKIRDGPPRPTTAEIDAQYSRRSYHKGRFPPCENDTEEGSVDAQEPIEISSDNESDSNDVDDMDGVDDEHSEDDEEGTEAAQDHEKTDAEDESEDVSFKKPSGDVDSHSEADPYAVQDSYVEVDLRTESSFNDSMLLEDLQESIGPTEITDSRTVDGPNKSISLEKEQTPVDGQSTSASRSETERTDIATQSPERRFGKLPATNEPASRFRERQTKHLREMQRKVEDATEPCLPQVETASTATMTAKTSNAHPPGAREALLRRAPPNHTSAESSTKSRSQLSVMAKPGSTGEAESPFTPQSTSETSGDVEPWVRFEDRPRTPGGRIDAGRTNFPLPILPEHGWVSSEDAMYTEAKRRAKPEWVEEMYEYIKTDNLILIRMSAGDQEDLQRLWKKQHRARKARRKKMGLPPLHTLRKEKGTPEGAPTPLDRMNDQDSNYEPRVDEDDNSDYALMLKVPSGEDARLQKAVQPGAFPFGMERDRHFEEIGGDDNEAQDGAISIHQPVCETEGEDEACTPLQNIPLQESLTESLMPTSAELQDLPRSDDEIVVYDAARRFVRTTKMSDPSRSPIVQVSRCHSPSKFEETHALAAAGDANLLGVEQSMEDEPIQHQAAHLDEITARNVPPKVGARDSVKNLPAEVDLEDRLVSGEFDQSSVPEDTAQGKKRRKRSRKSTEARQSQSVKHTERAVEPELVEHEDEGAQKVQLKEHLDRSRASSPSLPRSVEETTVERTVADDNDRQIMPPPAATRQDLEVSRRQRQDSVSSQLTSDTSSSRYGLKKDGAERSRRSFRRHKSRRHKDCGKSDSPSIASDVVVTATPDAQLLPDSEDDSFASVVTAPETQEVAETQEVVETQEAPETQEVANTQELAESIEVSRPTHTPSISPPPRPHLRTRTPKSRDTSLGRPQRLHATTKFPGAGGLKRLLGFSAHIPPPPQYCEPESAQQVRLPYSSDREDSSSDESD